MLYASIYYTHMITSYLNLQHLQHFPGFGVLCLGCGSCGIALVGMTKKTHDSRCRGRVDVLVSCHGNWENVFNRLPS